MVGDNDFYEVKNALKSVLKRYTFFEDENDVLSEIQGEHNGLEREIMYNYTDKITDVMRKVLIQIFCLFGHCVCNIY